MREPVEHLDLDDLIDLATGLVGEPPPIRDVGLLGSAAARPELNGIRVTHVANVAVHDFVIAGTVGHDDVDEIVAALRQLVTR